MCWLTGWCEKTKGLGNEAEALVHGDLQNGAGSEASRRFTRSGRTGSECFRFGFAAIELADDIARMHQNVLLVGLGFLASAVSTFVSGAHEAVLDEYMRTFLDRGRDVFGEPRPEHADEWASRPSGHRVCVFRPAAREYVATNDQERFACTRRGQPREHHLRTWKRQRQESQDNKQTFWCIRADVVRKLDRGEPEPETFTSGSTASSEALDASDPAPF